MSKRKKIPPINPNTTALDSSGPVDLEDILKKLLALEKKPSGELVDRSKLSRSTVRKYLKGLPIRGENQLTLVYASLEMIETRKRKVLKIREKQKCIAILEESSPLENTKKPTPK